MTRYRFETRGVHAGHGPDPTTGAIAPSIHLSTTFERRSTHQADEGSSEPEPWVYSRDGNPNRRAVEIAVADLEGGVDGASFSSGTAAAHGLLQALDPGDHVLVPARLYHGTLELLRDPLRRWGLSFTQVAMERLEEVAASFRPETRLVLIETPSNPELTLTDIAATAELAHRHGALLAVDNTWMTPVLQRPLELGADIVLHSSTKYFGGHSDVTGGVLVTRKENELWQRVRRIQVKGGAVPAPFDSWLIRRGLASLAVRVRAQTQGAAALAQFLDGHEAVERVCYPGLPGHPGRDIAERQTEGAGAMLSLLLRGGEAAARRAVTGVRLLTRGTSLGGVESLIEHRAEVEGPHSTTPRNLLRISVGLEHPADLISDLEQALRGR